MAAALWLKQVKEKKKTIYRHFLISFSFVFTAVDCYVSQWTEWNCGDSCIHGVQIRERHVTVKAAHGGKECPALKQKRVCRGEACDMQRVDKQRQELSGKTLLRHCT